MVIPLGFPIFQFWASPIKVIPETRRVHLFDIYFLAHLVKCNVNFCHHLVSVIRRPLTFHILFFSSETP
jgi:hypothetical protein